MKAFSLGLPRNKRSSSPPPSSSLNIESSLLQDGRGGGFDRKGRGGRRYSNTMMYVVRMYHACNFPTHMHFWFPHLNVLLLKSLQVFDGIMLTMSRLVAIELTNKV